MITGAFIREIRRAHDLDQSALARRAGTTQTYISRIERDEVSPSVRTLERLLHSMGLRLRLEVEPLSPGNASVEQLRADLKRLTARERLEQAMQLSEYLTGVAASAAQQREGTD